MASYMLKEMGMLCGVYNAGCVAPLDEKLLRELLDEQIPLITLEDHALQGGFGEKVAAYCAENGAHTKLLMLGVKGICVSQGARDKQLKAQGLDAESLAARILSWKENR